MKLSPVIVFTPRFDECLAFYRIVLGLEPRFGGGSYAEFPLDGTVFALHRSAEGSSLPGPVHLHFVAADLDLVERRARAHGILPVEEPHDEPWGREMSFVDPGGLPIDVLERTD